MTLDWLAADLRAAGITVREVDGWQTRARPGPFDPLGVLIHDTGTPNRTADAPSLQVCITGRRDLPGPLCQLLIARSADVWLIAGGRCNHAGEGALPHAAILPNTGNTLLLGIELENTGDGTEPWPARQVEVAQAATAVILRRLGLQSYRVWGHREYALPPGRKPDPVGIDMPTFRQAVAAWRPPAPPTPPKDDDMPSLLQLSTALATLDEVYTGHRGVPPTPAERIDWRKDFETKLRAGTELGPTFAWIADTLDAEKVTAKP